MKATLDDIPAIVEMGRDFCAAIGESHDDDSLVLTATNLIESDSSTLLIAPGAMAGAMSYPHFFNTNKIVAQELFWWVAKDKRGTGIALRLLRGLETWARNIGAESLTMVTVPKVGDVSALYERFGYTLLEKSYVKEL